MHRSEVFYSIQGEGKLAGTPSVFFRTSYCNIRCKWCDSNYTSWDPEHKPINVSDAMYEIMECANGSAQGYDGLVERKCRHVVITGGEPFIWKEELKELCDRLYDKAFHVTIETNATIYHEVKFDLISMSPKLSSSTPWDRDPKWAKKHESLRLNIPVIKDFIFDATTDLDGSGYNDFQLKFVITDCSQSEIDEIFEITDQLGGVHPNNIVLMPEGITKEAIEEKAELVMETCMLYGFQYSDRLHTRVWDNLRGV